MNAAHFSPDTVDFLHELHRHHVRYLLVGGEAVIFHGHARLTGDVDFFFDPTVANVQALYQALLAFWCGSIPGVESAEALMEEGLVLQFGVPPNRIDLMNTISGVGFCEAWPNRESATMAHRGCEFPVWYIGRQELCINKEASGRPKDLDDLIYLAGSRQPSPPTSALRPLRL